MREEGKAWINAPKVTVRLNDVGVELRLEDEQLRKSVVAERLRLVLVLELLADRKGDLPRLALAEVPKNAHVEGPVVRVSLLRAKRGPKNALFASKLGLAR